MSEKHIYDGLENVKVYLYKPTTFDGSSVFFVIHGANRSAESYRKYCVKIAEQYGAIVAAPKFNAAGYSKGGNKKTKWTFGHATTVFKQILMMVGANKFYLIGHSGGAQFVTRYIGIEYEFAKNATRIVAANAGTYAFPRVDWKWPYGFGRVDDVDTRWKIMFNINTTIYLGQNDTKQDAEAGVMNTSKNANKQGSNRLERGLNYFEFCKQIADKFNWQFAWELVEASNVGHDAKKMFNNKKMQIALGY
jgi:poly(3-hydroxybutyrate) depolymerase